MRTRPTRTVTVALTTALAAVVFSGCGTTAGYKQADKTGAGIAGFREEITKASAAVNETVKCLDDIATTANTDPRKAFESFSQSLANLESAAAKARKRAQDMKERGQAYFAEWEQQLAQINNPEIKNLAMQQRAKLQATFENIKKVAEPLKAQFDPWLSDLKDLQKYLSNDLTISGVDAAKSLFARTQAESLEVQKSMDALVAELNTVAATLTPAKVEAKK
jgi:hypothetical protein